MAWISPISATTGLEAYVEIIFAMPAIAEWAASRRPK
jgi:hypothetical protein